MYVKVMESGIDTSYDVSRLFYEPHIYASLNDEVRDVWGVHMILKGIEDGDRLCLGVYDDSDHFCGCVYFLLEEDTIRPHVLFKRGCDGKKALLLCEEEVIRYYKSHGMTLRYIHGVVSDRNRAIKLVLKKIGYTDSGIVPDSVFLNHKKKEPCRLFQKEVKNPEV